MSTRSLALYSAISEDVLHHNPFGPVGLGMMPPDASYKQFVSSYLQSSVMKKFMPDNTRDADLAAKEKFLTSNKKCEAWKLLENSSLDESLVNLVRQELDDFLHPQGEMLYSSLFDLLNSARVGPGSAVGASGFSLYAKLFSSQLTVTSPILYFAYREYMSWNPRFNDAIHQCEIEYGGPRYTPMSRVSFAPKTMDCSRMICVEPSLNMFFQLGLGHILESRLRQRFSIDLSTQPKINRRLAREGSSTGRFSTIDLSSASDSISLALCRTLLPSWFYDQLQLLRSPFCELDGSRVKLNMISTMGNGFTFPLQTIIFSSLIRAVIRSFDAKAPCENGKDWACFGDDLIIETKYFGRLVRLLNLLGFSVNSSKTFFEGPFRESCGADWFYGQPVRPVFVKKLDSLQDLFVAINLLNEWSAFTGISLKKAVSYLTSQIRIPLNKVYVPFCEGNETGIRVPLTHLPRDSIIYDRNKSILYRPFRSIPKRIVFDGEVFRDFGGGKDLLLNPSGLEISFLYGELRRNSIFVRQSRGRYRREATCVPFWDYTRVPDGDDGSPFGWQRWETAVLINLSNP